jgi:hypothetical protein
MTARIAATLALGSLLGACIVIHSPNQGVPSTLADDGASSRIVVRAAWDEESELSTRLVVLLGTLDGGRGCPRFDGVVITVNGISATPPDHCPTAVRFEGTDADSLREAEELDITLEDETGTVHAIVKNPMRLPSLSWRSPASGVVAPGATAVIDVFPGTEGFDPSVPIDPDDGSVAWWGDVDDSGPDTITFAVPAELPAGALTATIDHPKDWIYSVVECSGVMSCEAVRTDRGGSPLDDPGPASLQGTVNP